MILASAYASTPSGYVTGVIVPVVAILLGAYLSRRGRAQDSYQAAQSKYQEHVFERFQKQDETMAGQSEALAVLVAAQMPLDKRLTALESGAHNMGLSQARLQQTVDDYMRQTRGQ